ncbi:MAG: PfkB family carbohydrate kinase [Treponema sp.]|nr:PfkB family carbohydrate kinase [Treponema sp.]
MSKSACITVCLNPTLQKTLVFPHLVPDAVNRSAEYRFDVSGKGINVSRVLTQLGKKNIHITQLGGRFRPVFLELCAADNLNVRWVESGSDIRFCYTVIDREKNQTTELVEEGNAVQQGAESKLLDTFYKLLPEYSSLIISGTKAPGFSANIFSEMVQKAKAQGLFVILDIRGRDLLDCLPYKPDLIKPNLDEFIATFPASAGKSRINPENREEIAALCRQIHAQYGCRIVLTRGSRSIWYFEGKNLEEYPIEAAAAVNPIGSGDAFTAGLAGAFMDGASFQEALAEAARCGRLNAMFLKPGTISEILGF